MKDCTPWSTYRQEAVWVAEHDHVVILLTEGVRMNHLMKCPAVVYTILTLLTLSASPWGIIVSLYQMVASKHFSATC